MLLLIPIVMLATYLSDPHRTALERLTAIIRQPVSVR
jgi:hypothetical protein